MTLRQDLTAANSRIGNTLIQGAGRVAREAFLGLGSWRDADVDRYIRQIAPSLTGIKLQAARSTVAFYKSMADLTGQDFTRPVFTASDLATKELRNGAGTDLVYRRPFVDMRTALSRGSSFSDALEAGARRAQGLAQTEVQLARRDVGLKARNSNDRIVGYIRTLTGQENCALCFVASTQRYTRGELMPIHPGCDCGEMPIYGTQDPGQVINEVRLEAVHENIETRFGVSDRGARELDYRAITITEHGEMGPMLTVRGQEFKDFNNLDLTDVKTYSSVDDIVADAENLQNQIDLITDPKLDSRANGNVAMRALLEQSGKNGPPELVDTVEELGGEEIWYRGSSNENIDGFMMDERHRIGLGIHGDGYYFSNVKSTADAFATYGQGQGFADGKVMTAALKPDAKIFKVQNSLEDSVDLSAIQNSALRQLGAGTPSLITDAQDFVMTKYYSLHQDALVTDLILQGYDGIEVNEPKGATDEKYLVLFNRAAVKALRKTEVPFAE